MNIYNEHKINTRGAANRFGTGKGVQWAEGNETECVYGFTSRRGGRMDAGPKLRTISLAAVRDELVHEPRPEYDLALTQS